MKNSDNFPNKLIESNSPYLLQHAYNPVSWQPWNEEAWNEAREKQKLVLVSIGYSACHWCHVMEHESFEDHQTAEMMNISMINIKVDREERPDIDMIYMDACQLMTGKGGWPLNVICLPDGRPVYAGTYFPKPQWQQLIMQLTTHFNQEPEKFEEYANKLYADLKQMNQTTQNPNLQFSRNKIHELFATFANNIDWEHGGQNRSPKFMLPGQFEFALDYHLLTGNVEAKEFLHLSLLKMFNGGIYDTLRGGFFRYSTDKFWFAPHFEKMLYDNAQLISLYSRAFAWSQAPVYKQVVEECIKFCHDELYHMGGYFSAIDADSDGIEGRYYVFTDSECKSVLNEREYEFAKFLYNIKPEGNWEHEFNILHTQLAPLQMIDYLNLTKDEYHLTLNQVKSKLLELQNLRNKPSTDFKVILSWNALMLKGLSNAALYLNQNDYQKLAEDLFVFIEKRFIDPQSHQLKRIFSQDNIYGDGSLEDYAGLSEALLCLYDCTQKQEYLAKAQRIAQKALELFYEKNSEQLYFSPNNGEQLIFRKSDKTDDVMPSANSIFANVLFDLGTHLGNLEYIEISKKLLTQVSDIMFQHPGWYQNWAKLYMKISVGSVTIALSNNLHQHEITKLKSQLPSWSMVGFNEENGITTWLKHPNTLESLIHVCAANQCFEAVDTTDKALEIIDDVLISDFN